MKEPPSKDPPTGLIAAPHTPLRADGEVDLSVIDEIAALLVDNGVGGAFVCGTTGEGLSLTVDERMRVAERWSEAAGGRLRLLVQVGANAVGECRALAEHARRIGADAIAALPPTFYRPKTVEGVVAFCAHVAAAAPELPFYYYPIPDMTGVDFAVHDLLTAAAEKMPTLAGVKFSSPDLSDFGRCARLEDGRYNMLYGLDEMLLPALTVGAAGAVGATYSFAAPLYHRVIRAYEAGDVAAARADQAKSQELVRLMRDAGGVVPAGKAMMKMIGVDCGPVRTPLRNLSARRYDKLRADLEAIGFFQYCSKV